MAVAPHNDQARVALIEAFSDGLSVSEAARRAGLSRRHAYRLRDTDPRVRAAWPSARPRRRALAADSQTERERELRAQALEVLAQLATDEEQPVKARVDAAKALARLELPPVQVEASRQADADDDDDEPLTTERAAELVRYRPPNKEVRA